jgi:hypothetical protein
VEISEDCLGVVMQLLANRKAQITAMHKHPLGTTIEAVAPTRGLIGLETDLVNATSGRGVISHLFKEYGPWAGDVLTRLTGTLVATESGESKAYALVSIQERGKLFIGAGEQVYEGMLVGENPRQEDIPVNASRAKRLTNFRSQGEGVATQLSPPVRLSIEKAIEYIADDEFVEATPKALRLRKRILNQTDRRKADRADRKGETTEGTESCQGQIVIAGQPDGRDGPPGRPFCSTRPATFAKASEARRGQRDPALQRRTGQFAELRVKYRPRTAQVRFRCYPNSRRESPVRSAIRPTSRNRQPKAAHPRPPGLPAEV